MTIRPAFTVREVVVLQVDNEREERRWAVYYGESLLTVHQTAYEAGIIADALNHAAPPGPEGR